jgi:hypothetical protein
MPTPIDPVLHASRPEPLEVRLDPIRLIGDDFALPADRSNRQSALLDGRAGWIPPPTLPIQPIRGPGYWSLQGPNRTAFEAEEAAVEHQRHQRDHRHRPARGLRHVPSPAARATRLRGKGSWRPAQDPLN